MLVLPEMFSTGFSMNPESLAEKMDGPTVAWMMQGAVKRDETLQHPRCVFQLLRKHYARYTPEMVSRICGAAASGRP